MQAEAVKEAESGGGGGWWGWATGWVSGEGDSKEEEAIVMPTGELIFTSECPNVSAISDTEEELQEERRKMYEAIGYSQNAELPIYPKEVSRLSTLRSRMYMYMCTCIQQCTCMCMCFCVRSMWHTELRSSWRKSLFSSGMRMGCKCTCYSTSLICTSLSNLPEWLTC